MADIAGGIWRAAAYLRLSREDGDKEESDSIASQRAILTAYAREQPDISLCEEFTDDGFSGTNFNRPAFSRMLAELYEKRINCVLVKDLSRLGRDYIEVGRYLEHVFPRHNVRFVAVTERLDSALRPDELSGIAVPIKNLMNDEYCRDIARKVKSALDIRRKNGQFIGNYAPYGYLKESNNPHNLIVDCETADTVRQIFNWFVHGENLSAIARRLDGLAVPTPSQCKKQRGQSAQAASGWSLTTLRRILSDQTYCGDLVQGKSQIKAYKLRQVIAVPRERWMIVSKTHEALVSRETYDAAQRLLCRKTRRSPDKPAVFPLAGLVFCADCGSIMHRHSSQAHAYMVCSMHKKNAAACPHASGIRADRLEAALLHTLQQQLAQLNELPEILNAARTHRAPAQDPFTINLKKQTCELERLQNAKAALYVDWKNEEITHADYKAFHQQFDTQIERCRAALSSLQRQCRQAKDSACSRPLLTALQQQGCLLSLTRACAVHFFRAVHVSSDYQITIDFQFSPVSNSAADL